MIEADTADVMADEPIWAKGIEDFGTCAAPHSAGVPRYASDGTVRQHPEMQTDGEWRVVGWVTSGGYAHGVEASMAQGYVPAALAERGETGMFEIEILGVRRPARIAVEPPFDPAGERMRS